MDVTVGVDETDFGDGTRQIHRLPRGELARTVVGRHARAEAQRCQEQNEFTQSPDFAVRHVGFLLLAIEPGSGRSHCSTSDTDTDHRVSLLNGIHNILTARNLPEHCVPAIQMGGRKMGNEELTAIRIRPGIGHGNGALLVL